MAVKSIIDIDVKDAAFKNFQAAFAKYQDALKKMPGDWAKVGAASQANLDVVEASANELRKTKAVYDQLLGSERALTQTAKERAKSFKQMVGNVTDITFQLAKWAAIGGLAGMRGLGQLASNVRKTSQGLGVTPGDLRAAQINYKRYFDPESMLGNIANTQSDLTKRGYFAGLGFSNDDVTKKSAADLLPLLLPKLVEKFKQGGSTQQGMQAFGLDNFADIETLRRLASLSPKELDETATAYSNDRKELAVDDATLSKWQKFNAALDKSINELENVFIAKLVELAPAISELASTFVKATKTFFVYGDKLADRIANLAEKAPGFFDYDGDNIDKAKKAFNNPVPGNNPAGAATGRTFKGNVIRRSVDTNTDAIALSEKLAKSGKKFSIFVKEIDPSARTATGKLPNDVIRRDMESDSAAEAIAKEFTKTGQRFVIRGPEQTVNARSNTVINNNGSGSSDVTVRIQNETGGNAVAIVNQMAR